MFAWPPEARTGVGAEPGEQDAARLPDPYEAVAARLAGLSEADNAAFNRLTEKQQSRSRDKAYLDRLVRGEEPVADWLRTIVEIRLIGHRLNEEGGMPLMVQVCERAGAVSRDRATRRSIEADWDQIGRWRG
ncbi:hypothetical protein ABZ357_10645 [Streptomyces sp. NPDC005917]|uniref:hypothetical protein n=1 Tax=unclassified Streptomyces TaxID=2593676 RepID=UPI003404ACF4